MYSNRPEFYEPKYKRWSYAVKAMYGFTCALCKRDSNHVRLESHHIKPFARCNEREKYSLSNGACLCLECHQQVTGKEDRYAEVLTKITKEKLKTRKNRNQKHYLNKRRESKKKTKGKDKKRNKKWYPRSPRFGL